ncbi:MAG: acyltransferase family protein [Bacteroidales bacterium]|nr:acyltransferase family protein [Bacteroidales bacterium]
MFRFAEPAQQNRAGWRERTLLPRSPRIKSVVIVPVSPHELSVPAPRSTNTASTTDRLHHLDALRGLLMLLGIVLHAALIYSVESDWVIGDARRSRVFDWIYAVIHAFRMQTFFMISGILTVRMLKKGPTAFLRDRGLRLAIPLLTIALTLNALQTLLAFGGTRFWEEYSGGRWVGHLWFIVDLLIFCVLVAGLTAWRPEVTRWHLPQFGGAIIGILPLGTAGAMWLRDTWIGHDSYGAGLFTPAELLVYFPFFLFGFLYRPGTDPARLRQLALWSIGLLVGCLVNPFPQLDGMGLYVTAGISWSASILCLYGGSLVLNRPHPFVRTLSDAAYTVYLVHHLAVIVFGLLLLPLTLAIGGKFLIVVLGTCGVSFAFHRGVVSRSRWLSLLMNGNTRPVRMRPG